MTGMEANRRLAELMGWTGIFDDGKGLLGMPPAESTGAACLDRVPDWANDWNAAGPLMVQFIRRAKFWPHRAVVGTGMRCDDLLRDVQPGESEAANIRRLFVDAAIAELEARG